MYRVYTRQIQVFSFFARKALVGNIAKLWGVIPRYICGSNMHAFALYKLFKPRVKNVQKARVQILL